MTIWFAKGKWRYRFRHKGIKYYGPSFEKKEDAQYAETEKKIYLGIHTKTVFRKDKEKLKTTAAMGMKSESIVLATLVSMGLNVLIPYGHNHRYDLVVESSKGFIRIQCKTGRMSQTGSIIFNACSVGTGTGKRKAYKEEADYFAVYCPKTGGVYMIPVNLVPGLIGSLRIITPELHQEHRLSVRRKSLFAQDYEIGKFFSTLESSRKKETP